MIKTWLVTGDTHGMMKQRIQDIIYKQNLMNEQVKETALIILGDAGLNFFLDSSDSKRKVTYGMKVYCVRGNHEERPENLDYELEYDEEVDGFVYVDPINQDIVYFKDGEEYVINGHKTLVIGGAYSIDKWYRLQKAAAAGRSFTGWFESEQLTLEEMDWIAKNIEGKTYDFVLTHTCPIDWEPVDLFISGIDQSTVDKTIEQWMSNIKNTFNWKVWLFGHYHDDRYVRKGVEMFYTSYCSLDQIWEFWQQDRTDYELELMKKDPKYHEGR